MQEALWNKLEQESSLWYSRFLLYRNIKPLERSYLKAYNLYQSQVQNGSNKLYNHIPGTWEKVVSTYRWKERAEAYDAHIQAERERNAAILREMEQAEEQRLLTTGYAKKSKRIEELSSTVDLIKRSFKDMGTDEIVFQFVTPDKIRELRGCLDDIAKELGERSKKTELTGKVEVQQRNPDLATLTNEELDQLHDLLIKASERRENATVQP
jgi:hypothetical protein